MFSEEKRDFLHFSFEKSLKSLTFSQKPLLLTPIEITVLLIVQKTMNSNKNGMYLKSQFMD